MRRFVFVSSIAVYGRAAGRVDEHAATRPEDNYGRSKLEAEDALRAELSGSETDWCILRLPAEYGPGSPGNMSRLQALVASGVPLPCGAIRNSRSFISVDNLVDAILTVLRYPRSIRAAFVVSDGSDFATPAIVRAFALGSRRRVRLLNVPVPVLRLLGRFWGSCRPDSWHQDRTRLACDRQPGRIAAGRRLALPGGLRMAATDRRCTRVRDCLRGAAGWTGSESMTDR